MYHSYTFISLFNPTLTKYLLFTILLLNVNNFYSQEKFKIVIDAGHGGKDPGRPTKFGFTEKEIALNAGIAQDAAEVVAGKAALGNMMFFPLALVLLFGILFAFRKKLEEKRVSHSI